MKFEAKIVHDTERNIDHRPEDVFVVRLVGDDGKVIEVLEGDLKIPVVWVKPIRYDSKEPTLEEKTKKLIIALNDVSREMTMALSLNFWKEIK